MKTCSKCKQTKPYEDFHNQSSSRDGKGYYCKPCNIQQRMDKYEFKKEKLIKNEKEKQCRSCKVMYPIESFKKRRSGYRESYCLSCIKTMGTTRNISLYGISSDQYYDMFNEQNGVCKICKKPETTKERMCIDHNHSCCPSVKNKRTRSCGKCIRGLICFRCNVVLGMVKDDEKLLNEMIRYIKIY
jgi:hypothetical protein